MLHFIYIDVTHIQFLVWTCKLNQLLKVLLLCTRISDAAHNKDGDSIILVDLVIILTINMQGWSSFDSILPTKKSQDTTIIAKM